MRILILFATLLLAFACKKQDQKTYTGEAVTCTTPELLGKEMALALSEGSMEHYLKLTPTLDDLHSMMSENALFYGGNLAEAKKQITSEYTTVIMPTLKNKFQLIIKKGQEKQINWADITLKGITTDHAADEKSPVNVNVLFSCNGKTHTLVIQNVSLFNGKYLANQFIELL